MAESLSFGDLLKRYRLGAGLTQEALAERARLSARTVSDLERGVKTRPYKDTITLLAEALALPATERAAMAAAGRTSPPRSAAGQQTRPPVVSVIPRGPASPVHHPLVGRGEEVALLERQLSGEGPPLLVLAGEPGIGKSRLLRHAAALGASYGLRVLQGGCQRRGGQEPYAPLLEALEHHFAGQSPAPRRAALEGCGWLARLLPELAEAGLGPTTPWTLTPEQERRLVYRAVVRFLTNVAGPSGTLLLLDDLQWADRDGLDLLAVLVRAASEIPLRLVAAYRDVEVRPEDLVAVVVADLAQEGLATQCTLGPLAAEEVVRLLDDLLHGERAAGEHESAATVREQVLARAGGVPFFVVSYAHAVRRGRGEAEGLPENVAQSVRQRVAALPPSARTLLGVAAVVGRTVPLAVLLAAAAQPEGEVLAALEAACHARLLVDAGTLRIPARAEAPLSGASDGRAGRPTDHASFYHFAHDVIREVLEGDLGTARRLVLHRRVGAALEEVHAGRLAEQYEALAYHYLQAEVWETALEYLVKSGDKAAAAGATQAALSYYGQALALCDMLGAAAQATAATVAQKRGDVCFDSGDFPGAVADFERMRAAAAGLGDRRLAGLALAYRGMSLEFAHDFEASEESLQAALAIAEEGFPDVCFFANVQLADTLTIIGRHAEAASLLAVAEELAPRVDAPFGRAWLGQIGALVRRWAGRYDDALAHLERWRGAADESRRIVLLVWIQLEEAMARAGRGEYAPALALLDEVIATCERIGEAVVRARALNTVGWIYGELQDHQHALELNGQSLDMACAIEVADTEIQSNARLNLADNLLALGRLSEAEEHLRAVEQIVRHPRPQDRWALEHYAQHLFHSYGELCLARGETKKALAYAGACLELAEPSACRKNIVKARRLRGQVLLAGSQLAEAETELTLALQVAREVGNPPQLWQTLASLGSLRLAEGRPIEAANAYGEALRRVEEVAAGLADAALRAVFLASPHVQGLRQQAGVATP